MHILFMHKLQQNYLIHKCLKRKHFGNYRLESFTLHQQMTQQTNSDVHSINSDNVEVKMYKFAAETNIFTFLNAGVNIFINS